MKLKARCVLSTVALCVLEWAAAATGQNLGGGRGMSASASRTVAPSRARSNGNGSSGVHAQNATQGVNEDFGDGRVSVASTSAEWGAALELSAYGCGGDLTPLARASAASAGQRVEYRRQSERGLVTEWYENTPAGLEQGFTLERAPCVSGDVALEISVHDLTPRLATGGDAVDLLDEKGATRLHYSELRAVDASGKPLKVAMTVAGERIALHVDARDAAYPVLVDPLIWTQQGAVLVPTAGSSGLDYFATSVSISGDTAVVGDPGDQGSAYVFVRSGTAWAQQGSKLVATDTVASSGFGETVGVSGDTAVIGTIEGAAYVFTRSGSTWSQQGGRLVASDGKSLVGPISVSGNTVAIGTHVFTRSGTAWSQQGPVLTVTGADSAFGSAVSLSGDTLLVGDSTMTVDTGGVAAGAATGNPITNQGGAYVFVRSGTTWLQQGSMLVASDAATGDGFGYSVSVSGDTAIVGASSKTIAGKAGQGAAYAFVRLGSTWSQQGAAFVSSDGAAHDSFGYSVAVSGDAAIIGTYGKSLTYLAQGAAYVFTRSGGAWSQQGGSLVPTNYIGGKDFGAVVALSGGTAIIGAPGPGDQTAAVFWGGNTIGQSCAAGDGCLTTFCSDGVCCGQACNGACDACSMAAGASADGSCTILPGGSVGSPACGTHACNGASAACTACTQDAQCTPGHYCAVDGTCQPQLVKGAACDETSGNVCRNANCAVCATGQCTDGVCCDQACNGRCEACTAALTGSPDGTCTPIPADQDPRSECAQDPGYPDSCGADGLCDGNRECRTKAKPGTACGATMCDGSAVSGLVCNGAGACGQSTVACAPYSCTSNVCGTACSADSDCDPATGFCLNGTCETKKAVGNSCTTSDQCASSFCVDGVCCNSACSGQCEACSSSGTCTLVTGLPQGSRVACGGDPGVCGGACDGVNADTCSYAAATKTCGDTCSNGQETRSTCDGQGACVAGKVQTCAGYACGDTSCLTACGSAEDCLAGYTCQEAQCIPTGNSKCSTDLASSIPADGADGGVGVPCVPYVCDASKGSCKVACTSIDDCSTGSICDARGKCVPSQASASSSNGGACGCRVAGSSRPSPGALIALAVSGWLARRRRRSGQRQRDVQRLKGLAATRIRRR